MSLTKIYAPFTDEQVEALKKYQEQASVHPFTCCGYNGCKREQNNGILIPYNGGWFCPCGDMTQRWAWEEMIQIGRLLKV